MAAKSKRGERTDLNHDGDFEDTNIIVNEPDWNYDFNYDGDKTDMGLSVNEDRSVNQDLSFFDLGTAEMMRLCSSCHIGGGVFEGIPDPVTGNIVAYDDDSLTAEGVFDRDFYSFGGNASTKAYYSSASIVGSMTASTADFVATNWDASGVMEADCLICHIDPDHKNKLVAADGVKIDPNRPRMMIFAERDMAGQPTKISIGMPLHNALDNGVVRPYTDPLNRMSRPTPMAKLNGLPATNVGEMMAMWTSGLKAIEDPITTNNNNNSPMNPCDDFGVTPGVDGNYGTADDVYVTAGPDCALYTADDVVDAASTYQYPLPFALYGQNVPKIWDANGIIDSYCPNPYGTSNEMVRLMTHDTAINTLFGGFLTYMQVDMGMGAGFTMSQMMDMFFNDFIYAYNIKHAMDGLQPIPYGMRAYDFGNFYTDQDDFQASVRDYVRNPMIEAEAMMNQPNGPAYSGRTGIGYDAMSFGMAQMMCGNMSYVLPNGNPDTAAIMDLWQADITLNGSGLLDPQTCAALTSGTMQDMFNGADQWTLPSFFNVMPTAELMGLDLNNNGAPMTYVQLIADDQATTTGTVATTGTCVKQMVNDGWCAKTYYEYAEVVSPHLNIHSDMFGGVADAQSEKWTKVCGSCHVMLKDHDNTEIEFVRKYNLGFSSDFVKNGAYVNFTTDTEAIGYDVHMSKSLLGCGSCHLIQQNYHGENDPKTDLEAMHNFLKGTDTAHMVRNDLDNNIRPKNCEQCHVEQIRIMGGDTAEDTSGVSAADPKDAHEARFGEHTAVHMEKVSCQACHIPYKKTWRFRTFDDTLGYYGNFDDGMGYDVLPASCTQAQIDAAFAACVGQEVGFVYGQGTADMMAFPAEFRISPVYGPATGYGIPHFNMVAQHFNADGNGQQSMDYVSEMIDYFHITKSANPGRIINGMPTNPQFDFWKYFYQMFWGQKRVGLMDDDGVVYSQSMDQDAPDNEHFLPLYYANGTNGYPQIVTGNPITVMTWVDLNAGNDTAIADAANTAVNDGSATVGYRMDNIAFGGAKILYLREIMATISEYYAPTNIGVMTNADWGALQTITTGNTIPASIPAASYAGIGKVILKPTVANPSGWTLYDRTGDMYPEIWTYDDAEAVKAALKEALDADGGDANPMMFIAAHYFSDTHGVLPAGKALGAESCYDCHGDFDGNDDNPAVVDADGSQVRGAHRTTDRLLNFIPWLPQWFTNDHQVNLNPDWGGDTTPDGNEIFVIDHEIDYISPTPGDTHMDGGRQVGINGRFSFVGATQQDVLHWTEHLADHFFYQNHGEEVLAGAIYGLNTNRMSDEEKHNPYVPIVTNPRGNQSLKTRDWIPANIRHGVTAFGYAPVTQEINIELLDGSHQTAEAKVFIYGLDIDTDGTGEDEGVEPEDVLDGIIVKLSQAPTSEYVGAMYKPLVVYQQAGADFDSDWHVISDNDLDALQRRAQVVRFGDNNDNRYILRNGPGRYAAVHILEMTEAEPEGTCFLNSVEITGHLDACNVCDNDPINDNTFLGDNTTHIPSTTVCSSDCDGNPISAAGFIINLTTGADTTVVASYVDDCGECIDPTETANSTCSQGCDLVWGSGATEDECGVCDANPSNDNDTCTQDCNGDWDGTAFFDPNALPIDSTLDGNGIPNSCVGGLTTRTARFQDCNGDWVLTGTQVFDMCGVCGGVNDTCTPDCAGEWPYIAGTAEEGYEGNQVIMHAIANDPSHADMQDNVLLWYDSSRAIDDCGQCLTPLHNYFCDVELETYRLCDPTSADGCMDERDAYRACLASNNKAKNHDWNQSCDQDCAGKWLGDARVDWCGVCIDHDNPLDTRMEGESCSATCDTVHPYQYTDADTGPDFDAWIWHRDWTKTNYGIGSLNVDSNWDADVYEDMCDTCDADESNDCIQEDDNLLWQAGTAATVWTGYAETVINNAAAFATATNCTDNLLCAQGDIGSSDAATYCEQLSLGVAPDLLEDWRLPTRNELFNLNGVEYFIDEPYWAEEEAFDGYHYQKDYSSSVSVGADANEQHVRCVHDKP